MSPGLWRRRDCLKALLLAPLAFSRNLHAQPLAQDRIVAINWAAAELMLTLGIVPLAISDTGYFGRRIPDPVLPAAVRDIGPYWEPNLEYLVQLRPSLILSDALSPPMLAALAQIAPVEVVNIYPAAGDAWTSLSDWLLPLATRLNRTAQAQQLLSAASQHMADLRQQLATHSRPKVCVAVLNQDGKHATVYGQHSLVQSVLDRLGLENAWQQPGNRIGLANVGIDRLATLADTRLFYSELPTTADRLRKARQSSALWQHLPLVQQGDAVPLPPFFPFGGVRTALRLADSLALRLLSEP